MTSNKVTIIRGPKSWIEGAAEAQLEKVAELPGVEHVWGMPGVHPGPGHPIDAVFVTRDRIFPALVGSDIGCGMAWWRLKSAPTRPERWAKKIRGMERGIANPEDWLKRYDMRPTGFEHSLGTVGLGNHFSEFLVPDQIVDPQTYTQVTGDAPALLLVHSGSRGLGEKILFEHTKKYRDAGLVPGTSEAAEYLNKHDAAMIWARVNRHAIAERLFEMIGIDAEFLNDVPHNFVQRIGDLWFHRKGAIPTNRGEVIIPGSRNAHSYLVEPIVPACEQTGYSLSHGAGRKMSRRDARIKFNAERNKRLQRTKFNSIVICEDREMLMEEAGEAYKDISRVIQDLVDHGLVRVIAILKPVITYKYRNSQD